MQVPGASAAFEKAVDTHLNDLYRFAYWLCRNRWQAEDVVQDALVRAWRGWPGLREERAVKAWFFTIVHREFLRAAPSAARADSATDSDDLAFNPDPASSVDVERALRELSAESREALLMQVLGGFSCAEISSALGTTEGAVMTRLTRTRQALRRRLDPPDAKGIKQA